MADQKHKTPEELGEAVGKKIEELFGGFFGDDEPTSTAVVTEGRGGRFAAQAQATAPQPVVSPPPPQPQPAARKLQPISPQPALNTPPSATAPVAASPAHDETFQDIVDRLEALYLSLEWEASPDAVNEMGDCFRALDPVLPAQGAARTIVNMNLRILPKFQHIDTSPATAWLKLLQDSLSALKHIHATHGKQPPKALITAISANYKELIKPDAQVAAPPKQQASADKRAASPTPSPNKAGGTTIMEALGSLSAPTQIRGLSTAITAVPKQTADSPFKSMVIGITSAARSIEEVSLRLTRILGVLRQGRSMSPDEVTRRLGTLEHLLNERVVELSKYSGQLAASDEPTQDPQTKTLVERGLSLFSWYGILVAVPTSTVLAVFPVAPDQAKKFDVAPAIVLGKQRVKRLALTKPPKAPATVPTMLLHFFCSNTHYFLLTDKMLGYRLAPKGVNIYKDGKIKIGPATYITLNGSLVK